MPDTSNPLVLATLGERFAGALLDGLIGIVVAIPIWGVLFAIGTVSSVEEMGKVGPALSIGMGLLAFVLIMAVQYVPLKQSGQTWGKRVMKTRIATMKGEKPTITDLVFKRYAFFQLLGVIPVVGTIASLVNILMIFKKDRRCLHDLIAGTQVVKVAVPVAPPVAL
ncbi:MAG: RDD family protein [Verrucomicrobiaceae bacterium]|nr:MAG: RDD family protein [Verrucomicrobiaceae bacterium]